MLLPHESLITARINDHLALMATLLEDATYLAALSGAGVAMAHALRAGRKVLFFGNGGSAADAQHLAAELTGRFLLDRRPLPALALTTNSSALTAIGNDYGYEDVFARPLAALGAPETLPSHSLPAVTRPTYCAPSRLLTPSRWLPWDLAEERENCPCLRNIPSAFPRTALRAFRKRTSLPAIFFARLSSASHRQRRTLAPEAACSYSWHDLRGGKYGDARAMSGGMICAGDRES